MDAQEIIARRIARELRSGMLVNLGIGIPTLVTNYLPAGINVFFQSENGLIGTGPVPEPGMGHPTLTDAAGRPVTALPGACTFDSAMSFGLIRGGHVDLTVLGGLQVDATGRLANWMIPKKMVPGMGGAMDLVTGAKRVIVAMQHTAKGSPGPLATRAASGIPEFDYIAPTYDWSGFYFGGLVGGGWSRNDISEPDLGIITGTLMNAPAFRDRQHRIIAQR
jgi:3-oxoacid CoA-transferase B subunit